MAGWITVSATRRLSVPDQKAAKRTQYEHNLEKVSVRIGIGLIQVESASDKLWN